MSNLSPIIFIGIISALLLLFVAGIIFPPPSADLGKYEIAFQVLTILVLAVTGLILYFQLDHIRKQGEMQRIVAARASLQEMNKMIFSDKEVSFPLLYPDVSTEKAEALVMSFAAFNAWEVVYHMQKENNADEFRKLLSGLVKGSVIGQTWIDQPTMRAAYDVGFREMVNDILLG